MNIKETNKKTLMTHGGFELVDSSYEQAANISTYLYIDSNKQSWFIVNYKGQVHYVFYDLACLLEWDNGDSSAIFCEITEDELSYLEAKKGVTNE